MMSQPRVRAQIVESRDDVSKGRLSFTYTVAQWHQQPSMNEAYLVSFAVAKDKRERMWRSFGILDPEVFADLMVANPRLPMHVDAALWEGLTKNHASNTPDVLAKPMGSLMLSGCYTYGVERLVPDYLYYFRTRGLMVSTDFVKREFAEWLDEKHGRVKCKLEIQPTAHDLATQTAPKNPANHAGINGAVVVLGNGYKVNPADPHDERGRHHAFDGNIGALFEGGHDFYVLGAFTPGADDVGKPGDAVVERFKAQAQSEGRLLPFYLFAVRRDAVLATRRAAANDYVTPPAPSVAAQPLPPMEKKRERSPSVEPSPKRSSEESQ
jgi:hypothetical protein